MKVTICLPTQRVVVGCLCAVALAAMSCADGPGAPAAPSATAPDNMATAAQQADAPSVSASSARSGAFQVTKECSTYTTLAGDHCTVIASDLKAIELGTRFVYLEAALNGVLDSDVELDPPGPGNNKAFGHCTLVLATGVGSCTFSGGTGKFTHFHSSAAVLCPADATPNCTVEGTYSFSPGD
jgi:hypothetical protein